MSICFYTLVKTNNTYPLHLGILYILLYAMHTYRQCIVLFQVLQLVLTRNNGAKTGIKYYFSIFFSFFKLSGSCIMTKGSFLKIVTSHFEIILDAAKPVFIIQFSIFCPLKYSFIRDHTCEAPRKNLTMLQCYYKYIESDRKKITPIFHLTIYEI